MPIMFKDSDLKALIAEVEKDLEKSLGIAKENLRKAAEDQPEEASAGGPPPAEVSAPPADGPPPAAATQDPGDGSALDAPPPGPEASAGAPVDAPADPGMDGGEAPLSVDELKAEYAEMGSQDPEMLKMHYLAAKAALFEVMGADADPAGAPADPGMDGGMDAGGPPPPPAPAPAMKMELDSVAPTKAGAGEDRLADVAPTKAGKGEDRLKAVAPAKAEKAELKASPGNGGVAVATKKSESNEQLEALQKSYDDLVNTVGSLAALLTKPERKAVTTVNAVAKPGAEKQEIKLTKSEAMAKLNEVAQNPRLSKNDRDLINSFCVGNVGLDKIEHLLRDSK